MPSEINVKNIACEKDNKENESEEQSVTLLTVGTINEGSSTTINHVETTTIRSSNKKIFMSNVKNDFIEQNENASSDVICASNENGLQQQEASSKEIINKISNIQELNLLEESSACCESTCNKENIISKPTSIAVLPPECETDNIVAPYIIVS